MPAFVGLGAPWWDAEARGALFGLTPQFRRRRDRARGARSGRLPDPRPARGDARRLAGRRRRHRAARRRRHGGERLHHAVPRRHPGGAGRPAGGAWRRPRSAPPISRACTAGLCPDLDGLRRDLAAASAASSRAMDAATRERKWAGWRTRCARTLTRALSALTLSHHAIRRAICDNLQRSRFYATLHRETCCGCNATSASRGGGLSVRCSPMSSRATSKR